MYEEGGGGENKKHCILLIKVPIPAQLNNVSRSGLLKGWYLCMCND